VQDQAQRAKRREGRITQGVDDLERWLQDFVRGGLAEAAGRPWSSFEQMSARLVDAQAPGLARFVRDLGGLPHTSPNWPERMLIDVGQLALLLDAWRQLDTLSIDLRAEVRALVGINEPRDEVLARPAVHDVWAVLGRRLLVGERLAVQRTWLWGTSLRRWALLLEFAAGGRSIERRLSPGALFAGDLHFFGGATPFRALFAEPLTYVGAVQAMPGQTSAGIAREFAQLLGRNPWLERMPGALVQTVPQRERDGCWSLGDAHARLPLKGALGWQLVALSGGWPIDVFGEWDGFAFAPLSAAVEGKLVAVRFAEAA
jgi:hypothetical protein